MNLVTGALLEASIQFDSQCLFAGGQLIHTCRLGLDGEIQGLGTTVVAFHFNGNLIFTNVLSAGGIGDGIIGVLLQGFAGGILNSNGGCFHLAVIGIGGGRKFDRFDRFDRSGLACHISADRALIADLAVFSLGCFGDDLFIGMADGSFRAANITGGIASIGITMWSSAYCFANITRFITRICILVITPLGTI